MTEEQMNRLESIIKTWLNNGAKCNSALKAYERSLYPTYDPGLRTKRETSPDRSSSKTKKKKQKKTSLVFFLFMYKTQRDDDLHK